MLVMGHGNVAKQGTRDELMSQGRFYANVNNGQFAQPLKGVVHRSNCRNAAAECSHFAWRRVVIIPLS
jgi:hypothetical protein